MQPTINPAVQSVLIVLKNLRHHHLRSGRLAFLLFGVFGFLCFVLLFLLLFLFLLLVLFTFVFAFRTISLCCLILRFPWHFCGPLNEQVEQTPGCWFLRLHMNHQESKRSVVVKLDVWRQTVQHETSQIDTLADEECWHKKKKPIFRTS